MYLLSLPSSVLRCCARLPSIAVGLCTLLLSCCPAPTTTSQLGQATAFRAEVVGVSAAVPALYVRLSPGAPLTTVAVAGAEVFAADGSPVALAALQAGGTQVYLTGALEAGRLWAREVRVLAAAVTDTP